MNEERPAFPSPPYSGYIGMMLREWYAGMAMQSLIQAGMYSDENPPGVNTLEDWLRHTSGLAFRYADAMLAEGKKDGGK